MPAPRGPALWLRRARELLSDLQAHAHAQTASASATAPTGASHTPAPPFRPPDWLRPPWDPPPAPAKRGEGWGGSAFRTPAPLHQHQHQHQLHQHRHQVRPEPAWLTPKTSVGVPNPEPMPPSTTHGVAGEMACAEPGCAIPAATPDAAPAMREDECGQAMRDVLRSVAQPVVVAVAATGLPHSPYHGATLTSFASLTLEPHPLVAFSLRLPSRMADCLRPHPPPPTGGAPVPAHLCAPRAPPTRLTISLLARANQAVADELARPGADHSAIFTGDEWVVRDGGLPSLRRAVGCLECQVVHSLPLRDVGGAVSGTSSDKLGSELFICRVLRASKGEGEDSLVHFQRDYFSVNK